MKLEGILKQDGWTDAEITALQPMLADARFRASMEKQYGAVSVERDELKTRDGKWQEKLDTEWQPRVTAMERDLAAARLELATATEKIKLAKEFGYLDEQKIAEADAEAAKRKLEAANGYDKKNHPTWEDVNQFAEAEGEAMVILQDLNAEYSYLNAGKSLFEYEAVVNGQQMRGMRALRQEAKAAKQNLDTYVSNKFKFSDLRAEMTAKSQREHDDAIRKDAQEQTRKEMAEQYGHPLLRTAVPSRNPIFTKPPEGGKMPWEIPVGERRAARLDRAMKVQLTGNAN